MKTNFQEVDRGLDRLFFSPFLPRETVEMRADAIEAYLEAAGWDWDSYLIRKIELEQN